MPTTNYRTVRKLSRTRYYSRKFFHAAWNAIVMNGLLQMGQWCLWEEYAEQEELDHGCQ